MLNKLFAITDGLNHRFPKGNDPYQIMTRLLEECGELAQQVNHFQDSGVKRQKYGEPNRAHLANEVKGALLCVLQVAHYYGVEKELEADLELSYQRLKSEGHIPSDD